jgi:hypothetical protein
MPVEIVALDASAAVECLWDPGPPLLAVPQAIERKVRGAGAS